MESNYTRRDLENFKKNFESGKVMGCGYYFVCSDPICPLKDEFEKLHVDPACHLNKEQLETFDPSQFVKELEMSRKRMMEQAGH